MATTKSLPQDAALFAQPKSNSKAVELILGAGGVKLFAHVGFLKAIEELKINFSTVTGVSGGSIIAAFYKNGFSPADIEAILARELHHVSPKKLARSMLVPAPLYRLFFREEPVSLLALMRGMVARYNLKPQNDLRLVAFNAITRKPVVFSGLNYDLATAMAASCSVPFVFRPILNGEEISIGSWLAHRVSGTFRWGRNKRKKDELLIDGGLYHPTPTAFCQGPAIIAKLGFASQPASKDLSFADRFFHNLEQRAARILDALFPDNQGEHILITVGKADVAALSFGISDRQQKALTLCAYRRTLHALKSAVAHGRVPVKQ